MLHDEIFLQILKDEHTFTYMYRIAISEGKTLWISRKSAYLMSMKKKKTNEAILHFDKQTLAH